MISLRNIFFIGAKNPKGFIQVLVNIPKFIKLYVRLFKDARVPLKVKALLVMALLYLISPIDFIPDFIFPLVGFADDFVILFACIEDFSK